MLAKQRKYLIDNTNTNHKALIEDRETQHNNIAARNRHCPVQKGLR